MEGEFCVNDSSEMVDFDEFLNIGDGMQLMTPPTTELHRDFTNDSVTQCHEGSPTAARSTDHVGNYHIYGSTSGSVVTSSLVASTDTLVQTSQTRDENKTGDCSAGDGKLGEVDLSTVLKLRSRNLQLRRCKSTHSVYQRPRYRSHSTSNLQTPPSSSALTPNNSNSKVKRNPFYCPSGKVLKIIEKEKKKQGDAAK